MLIFCDLQLLGCLTNLSWRVVSEIVSFPRGADGDQCVKDCVPSWGWAQRFTPLRTDVEPSVQVLFQAGDLVGEDCLADAEVSRGLGDGAVLHRLLKPLEALPAAAVFQGWSEEWWQRFEFGRTDDLMSAGWAELDAHGAGLAADVRSAFAQFSGDADQRPSVPDGCSLMRAVGRDVSAAIFLMDLPASR
jgi:hypothetical protein